MMSDYPIITDRALLELLYDISREFAAALDLRTVLHRVVMLSMKTVGAVSGSILVLDELGKPVDSALILGDQPYGQNTSRLGLTYERGLAGWVGRHRQAVLVEDTSKDERWLQRPDDAVNRTGPKSAISAPILVREQLVGVITLVHPQPGFFTRNHLALFKAIADQAGIAILNARLYTESQRRAQVMTAVAESAAVITAALNLDEVLQRILEQVIAALRASGAFLALGNSQAGDLEVRAVIPKSDAKIIGKRISYGEGIAGWVAREGLGVIVNDVNIDKRFSAEVDQISGFASQAILSAPLRSEGQIIGVLEVINPTGGSFEQDDLLVLMGIGGLAGTAIRRAELYESLQAAHKRHQELFEDSIDMILITDWTGKVVEANRRAQITCDLARESPQVPNIDELHMVDWEKVGQNFNKLVSGQMISYESILQAQSSPQLPVQVYVRNILGEGASQLQWIIRDISERKDLDRLREDMLAMIYHDLRSPLANINSSLEILSKQPVLDADVSNSFLIKIALRSTERIQRLTDSLLDINRLESGQVIVDRQLVAPDVLVRESVEVVLPVVKSKEIDFQVLVPPDLPAVQVEADMIRRAIINLLENAVKFTPSNGKIWLEASHQDDFIRISVRDTGPGIPAEDRERIFSKFTRLNSSSSPRGFGLGLAFCHLAITRHGGRIWVESEVGSGSSFNFILPVAS